jgi:hypothetical protein
MKRARFLFLPSEHLLLLQIKLETIFWDLEVTFTFFGVRDVSLEECSAQFKDQLDIHEIVLPVERQHFTPYWYLPRTLPILF